MMLLSVAGLIFSTLIAALCINTACALTEHSVYDASAGDIFERLFNHLDVSHA